MGTAGFSVGEYASLVLAGSLAFEDGKTLYNLWYHVKKILQVHYMLHSNVCSPFLFDNLALAVYKTANVDHDKMSTCGCVYVAYSFHNQLQVTIFCYSCDTCESQRRSYARSF